jgi:hypothetical protein
VALIALWPTVQSGQSTDAPQFRRLGKPADRTSYNKVWGGGGCVFIRHSVIRRMAAILAAIIHEAARS